MEKTREEIVNDLVNKLKLDLIMKEILFSLYDTAFISGQLFEVRNQINEERKRINAISD